MLLKANESAVKLPFQVNLEEEEYVRKVITETAIYHNSLGLILFSLQSSNLNKKDSARLISIISDVKDILIEIDEVYQNHIDRETADEYADKTGKIIERISNLSYQGDKSGEEIFKSLVERLFVVVNTMKAFFDNCFRSNFM